MDTKVTNNKLANRFEVSLDGNTALLEYTVTSGLMTLVHTDVPVELGGQGVGGKLVKYALDHAKQNKLQVVAQCEFAQSYIKRHRGYSSLLYQTNK